MKKIHLIFEIPVFSEDIRNNAPLKKTQKLILCDTSIATSILKFNKQKMKNQLNFLGHLFENYVIRDLSVYADYNDLDISYYKDKHDGEIDCIISNADGE
jgi:predicted AAA+ superfamily ATPase